MMPSPKLFERVPEDSGDRMSSSLWTKKTEETGSSSNLGVSIGIYPTYLTRGNALRNPMRRGAIYLQSNETPSPRISVCRYYNK